MEIYPHDLNIRMYRKLIRQRCGMIFTEAELDRLCEFVTYWQALPAEKQQPGLFAPELKKAWMRKKGWIRRAAPFSLIAAAAVSFPLWIHDTTASIFMPIVLFTPVFLGLWDVKWPAVSTMLNYSQKPVTDAEKESLISASPKLLGAYWTLLTSVRRSTDLSADVQESVRAALSVIDNVMEQHSAKAVDLGDTQPETFLMQAEEAESEADREPDSIAAASLRRQANALRTSADVAHRYSTIRRRSEVMEREITAQIQAMNASLVQYQHGGNVPGEEFLALARNIQQVASEAAANAAAREELRVAIAPDYEPVTVQSL